MLASSELDALPEGLRVAFVGDFMMSENVYRGFVKDVMLFENANPSLSISQPTPRSSCRHRIDRGSGQMHSGRALGICSLLLVALWCLCAYHCNTFEDEFFSLGDQPRTVDISSMEEVRGKPLEVVVPHTGSPVIIECTSRHHIGYTHPS